MRFRNILPVFLAMVALSSCSVYRSGQTPDDVYYSPGPSQEDSYMTVDNTRKGRSYGRYDNTNPDDNYLRMRVRDRYRWSAFDNYSTLNDWQYNGGYYGMYNPYYSGIGYNMMGYNMGMGFGPYGYYNPWSFNSYWNSYYHWNSYYNPYCPGIIVGSYKTNPVVYNSVRNFNMATYNNNNTGYNNRNRSGGGRPIYQSNNGRYNTRNDSYYTPNSNSGGGLRRVYPSNSSNGTYRPSSSPAPVRTYSPSSSGGSSRGSSGGSGGGGSRPSRGG